MTQSPTSNKASAWRRALAGAFALGIVALFVLAQSSSPSAPPEAATTAQAPSPSSSGPLGPQPAPPTPELVALLDGLRAGDDLAGWKVVNFLPTNEGVWWVQLEKGEAYFSVGIWSKGKSSRPLPIQTELYEVGYGLRHPLEVPIGEPEMKAAAEQVAARIRKRETGVAKPAGL